jgi:hypothetical protein
MQKLELTRSLKKRAHEDWLYKVASNTVLHLAAPLSPGWCQVFFIIPLEIRTSASFQRTIRSYFCTLGYVAEKKWHFETLNS